MTETTGFEPESVPAPVAEVQPEPAPEPPPVPDAPFIPDQGVADWLREALLYLHGLITGS